jgi:lipopolysaccharide biosynthesis protein
MAAAHGIDGFVYYHYWFGGRRILERPFDEVLRLGEPSLPFCLCWANENWTRIWDGGTEDVLLRQEYSEHHDRAYLRSLAEAFEDRRYIRVAGKPLLLVYRASAIPDARRTTDTWRDEAARLGLGDLYLARVENWSADRGDPVPLGFDAGVEFAPDVTRLGRRLTSSGAARALNRVRRVEGMRENKVYSYGRVAQLAMQQEPVSYTRFRGVTPGWDNSARRRSGGARILHGSTPALYQAWLSEALSASPRCGPDEHFVFINAWNEWAEGNHLEPDQRWGRQYLEATRAAVEAHTRTGATSRSRRGRVVEKLREGHVQSLR